MRSRTIGTLLMTLSVVACGLSDSVIVRSKPISAKKEKVVSSIHRIVGANDEGFVTGSAVEGATATLQRTDGGLKINIHTTDLLPGAYTIWWAFYNYPENCVGPCGFDDDFVPAVGSFWTNATGKVISNGDSANFAAHVDVGGPFGEVIVDGPGLANPSGAEVQLVIRYHGPAIPGIIEEQTSTFLGGCPDGGPPCQDMQFIRFEP